jgi:hypothetical protein
MLPEWLHVNMKTYISCKQYMGVLMLGYTESAIYFKKQYLRKAIMVLNTFVSVGKKNKLRGLSQQANYTDRAIAACRRS